MSNSTRIPKRGLFHTVVRAFLAGLLLVQSVAVGGASGTKVPTRTTVVGVRFANGDELYLRDCRLVDAAVRNEQVTSSGTSGCMGVTPLVWAIIHHRTKVEALLEAGADPNYVMVGGATALHVAASRGEFESVKLLLNAGADVTAVTDSGMTVLHALYQPCGACTAGNDESRRRIVARIISLAGKWIVNAKDNSGATPLYYAGMSTGADGKISELIRLNADPEVRDNSGAPPEFYAELIGNSSAASKLNVLAGNRTDNQDDFGRGKAEWVKVHKKELDRIRESIADPVPITASVSNLEDHIEIEGIEGISYHVSSCEFWMGLACAVVSGWRCAIACAAATGPFLYLCGAFCALIYSLGCYETVNFICNGPGGHQHPSGS